MNEISEEEKIPDGTGDDYCRECGSIFNWNNYIWQIGLIPKFKSKEYNCDCGNTMIVGITKDLEVIKKLFG